MPLGPLVKGKEREYGEWVRPWAMVLALIWPISCPRAMALLQSPEIAKGPVNFGHRINDSSPLGEPVS